MFYDYNTGSPAYICELCQQALNGESQLRDHFAGKKHFKNVRGLQRLLRGLCAVIIL